jgi:hypothetical protein
MSFNQVVHLNIPQLRASTEIEDDLVTGISDLEASALWRLS